MGHVVISMLPMIIGTAVVPIRIIIVLLLLRRPGGLRIATAFAAGMMLVRLAQGVMFGLILTEAGESKGSEESEIIAATLMMVLGIVLWIAAVKKYRGEIDPDDPPQGWMSRLNTISAPAAFVSGLALMGLGVKPWVFTLAALGVVNQADLGRSQSIASFLIYVLLADSLVILPLAMVVFAKEQTAGVLTEFENWLERYNRAIVIAVSAVFGTYFLWKGISSLI